MGTVRESHSWWFHWLHFSGKNQTKEQHNKCMSHYRGRKQEDKDEGGGGGRQCLFQPASVRSTADDKTWRFAQGHIITFIISMSIKIKKGKKKSCSVFFLSSYHAHQTESRPDVAHCSRQQPAWKLQAVFSQQSAAAGGNMAWQMTNSKFSSCDPISF